MTPAPIQIDRDLLVELYVNRGLSPLQIAAELAVGVRTVRDRLTGHRIPARPMGRPKGTGRPVLRPEKILTRRYLLDAAAIVFARDGFRGATLDPTDARNGLPGHPTSPATLSSNGDYQ